MNNWLFNNMDACFQFSLLDCGIVMGGFAMYVGFVVLMALSACVPIIIIGGLLTYFFGEKEVDNAISEMNKSIESGSFTENRPKGSENRYDRIQRARNGGSNE